jgi:lysophospholipase L1-like esterase
MLRKLLPLLLLIIFLVGAYGAYQYRNYQKAKKEQQVLGTKPIGQVPPDYLIILIGDSMTQYLGNSTELRGFLADYYPNKTFDIYNYGFGSTNILSVTSRLTGWTNRDRPYQPILDIDSDVIIIESFGHNPLSEFPLEEGLRKQEQALDEIVKLIKDKRPNSKIVFLTTISPNSKTYAYRSVDLSDEARKKWVDERISYIKNHKKYAKEHNIPLIDVFEKSLINGDGNPVYISDTDYIHPSPKGIILIQKEIADFMYQSKIL